MLQGWWPSAVLWCKQVCKLFELRAKGSKAKRDNLSLLQQRKSVVINLELRKVVGHATKRYCKTSKWSIIRDEKIQNSRIWYILKQISHLESYLQVSFEWEVNSDGYLLKRKAGTYISIRQIANLREQFFSIYQTRCDFYCRLVIRDNWNLCVATKISSVALGRPKPTDWYKLFVYFYFLIIKTFRNWFELFNLLLWILLLCQLCC